MERKLERKFREWNANWNANLEYEHDLERKLVRKNMHMRQTKVPLVSSERPRPLNFIFLKKSGEP